MLANVIATVMMALGVATGNVSSNVYKGGNAFYNAEKSQPIKKAIEEQTYLDISYTTEIQSITYTSGFNTNAKATKRYRGQQTTTPNIYTQFLNVNSTIYTCEENDSNLTYLTVLEVMQIDNYTDTAMNKINVQYHGSAQTHNNDENYRVQHVIKQYNNRQITGEMDKTITGYQSVIDIRNTILQTQADVLLVDYTQDKTADDLGVTKLYTADVDFTINYLEAHSNIQLGIYIRFRYYLPTYNNATIQYAEWTAEPTKLTIKGTPLVNDINYEVVDIPGLMFTVLTMPFSFISTAFNLTIFPGTPYQINFANLFMVLLATFILAWIIKKVFH